jgi:anaerobic magnesium-protoporphyrin IX monomethyl ester cyclase
MLSVGVVIPSWHYFSNPFKLQPLWELYFATLIDSRFSESKAKASVFDLRVSRDTVNGFNLENVAGHIPEQDVYFYWIMKSADSKEIKLVVNQLRKAYPNSRHIAGATHVDNFPEECAEFYDAIILGPGDESLIDAINDIKKGHLKNIYTDEWKQRKYSSYPFARRHYLPNNAIVNTELFGEYGRLLGTSAMMQRGCCFKCAFCVYNVPGYIQPKSNQMVEEEIEYLKREYKIQGLNLRDEIAIPLTPKVAAGFLNAIGRTNLKWRGQTKVGASKGKMVTREVLKLAAESGCVELAIGVESASQQVMDVIDKRQDISQVRDFISYCKEFKIKIKMCLILGLPGEPTDIVEQTIKFIEKTKPDFVAVSGFCPVPGSDIYNNQKYYGIKSVVQEWDKHAHLVYRFGDDEDFGLPFEYEDTNKWGKTFSRGEIIQNIVGVQNYLRERKMIY